MTPKAAHGGLDTEQFAQLMELVTNVRHYLIERGIDRHGEQQTKTKRALEFFAKGLKTA